MTPIDTAELERLDGILRDPLSGLTWDNRIMAADAIREVLAHRKAEAGMRALLLAGCDLLSIEAEGLRDGISVNGVMCPCPEDQATVEAIREMEDWIASVKATLYPTTPTTEASHGE